MTLVEQLIDNQKYTEPRLPKTYKPLHYHLLLSPNLIDFTFEGTVKIEYENSHGGNIVVLHSNELKIIDGECEGNKLQKVIYSPASETATLEFSSNLPSRASILLKFTGILNEKLKGFYRTSFKVGDETKYGAVTQFAPTDARRCFPCWDEPALKAKFTLTIEQNDPNNTVLSNMPVSAVTSNQVTFQETPLMSTYLLAFAIGQFECIEASDGKRPVRVYTTPGKKQQGQFALKTACAALKFYENYFEIDYPLPKMDLIAVPDFAFGAMENWGLITYREARLLVDTHHTSEDNLKTIALVVTHEIAHQWFGNLVTMEWWTDLWLNEGFASFMESLCADNIFPEYNLMQDYVTTRYKRALELDSLHNSHPIEVVVRSSSEIDEIFDDISYSKGSAVIRMLHSIVGDDMFRKGMNCYMNKFAYGNAHTSDLWDALSSVCNKPIGDMMAAWTQRTGYPWISIEELGDSKFSLTQSKFTSDGKFDSYEAELYWPIVLQLIKGNFYQSHTTETLCSFDQKTIQVAIASGDSSWFKLNAGAVGLYRCAYPDNVFYTIKKIVQDKILPPIDRLDILCDYFALCEAGKVKTTDLLELLSSFKGEDDRNVWRILESCFMRLDRLLCQTNYHDKFQSFAKDICKKIYTDLGWPSSVPSAEDHDITLHARIINILVMLGENSVIERAHRIHNDHLTKKQPIAADLRSVVYRAVASYGDEAAFNSLFELHKNADSNEEKNRLLGCLGFALDRERAKRVIDFIMSDEVRLQDKPYSFGPIGSIHPDLAFELIQDKKDFLREKYGSGVMLSRMIRVSLEHFASEEMAQKISKFFEDNMFPGTERTVQQVLETIRNNAEWLTRDGLKMRSYLEQVANEKNNVFLYH